MTEATLPPGHEQALSALDPRLSFLASQAAVELDNVLLGRIGNLEAVKQLGSRLQRSMGNQDQGREERTFFDAPTVSVLTDAISQLSVPVQTFPQLVSEAWQMATELQGFRGDVPPCDVNGIARLRSFCLFLSQNARSYRQSILDMQSELPYRS
jgi:hypothetical protein